MFSVVGTLQWVKQNPYFRRRTLPSVRELDNKQINMEAYDQSDGNNDYIGQQSPGREKRNTRIRFWDGLFSFLCVF